MRRGSVRTSGLNNSSVTLSFPSKTTELTVGFSTTVIIREPSSTSAKTLSKSPESRISWIASFNSAALKPDCSPKPKKDSIVAVSMRILPLTSTFEILKGCEYALVVKQKMNIIDVTRAHKLLSDRLLIFLNISVAMLLNLNRQLHLKAYCLVSPVSKTN